MSISNETRAHAHLASADEVARVASIAEPMMAVLHTVSTGMAVNVLVYLCTETMLNATYRGDGGKELNPVEGWELVSAAINKTVAAAMALEAAAKAPVR